MDEKACKGSLIYKDVVTCEVFEKAYLGLRIRTFLP